MFRLVFADIDGTLLNSHHRVTDRTRAAIRRISDQGVLLILASARMPSGITPFQQFLELKTPIISYNGAYVTEWGHGFQPKVLMDRRLSVRDTRHIYLRCQAKGVSVSLYRDDIWYVKDLRNPWVMQECAITGCRPTYVDFQKLLEDWERSETGPHKILCMGQSDILHSLVNGFAEEFPRIHVMKSKPTYAEIVESQVSKGAAALKILDTFGYARENVMAVGDSDNDIDMLKVAGWGVAMGNAPTRVQTSANEVTLSNDADGLAVVIEKYFSLSPGVVKGG